MGVRVGEGGVAGVGGRGDVVVGGMRGGGWDGMGLGEVDQYGIG